MNEEETGKSNELTLSISKDKVWKYSTFILLAVIIVGGFVFFTGDSGTTGNVVNTGNTGNALPGVVKASVDDDAVLGDKDAPVTIIEFSDYECPFCGRHYTNTYPLIKSEYIDTGKANLVFRDFPLTSIHPQAQKAAEAAECVGEQGGDSAFYEMHDKLFENQQSLSTSNFKKWAQELGYDISDCLDDGDMRSEVQKDLSDGQAAGGRGTPYFVIIGPDGEGTPISGAVPFSTFQQAIDAKLS